MSEVKQLMVDLPPADCPPSARISFSSSLLSCCPYRGHGCTVQADREKQNEICPVSSRWGGLAVGETSLAWSMGRQFQGSSSDAAG